MKRIFCVFLSLLLALAAVPSGAESLNLDQYTLDELISIRDTLNEEIAVRQKQWALEHANRTVAFEDEEILLYEKQKTKITPSVTRVTDDAPTKTVFTWSSSDPSVAVVKDGNITAVSKGTAVITCIAKDDTNVSGFVTVTVVRSVAGLKINASADRLLLGGPPEKAATDLQADIAPADAHVQEVVWSSGDESIATVDDHGHVQALKAGTVTITAVSADPSLKQQKKDQVKLTVIQSVTGIELNKTELEISTGTYTALRAAVSPSNAGSPKPDWSSSDAKIATVADGRVTGIAPGECVITAVAADGSGISAECRVKVIRPVSDISFKHEILSSTAGQEVQAQVQIIPEDASNKGLLWESSDPDVATVSEEGAITALSAGTSVITATAADGSGKYATLLFYVYPGMQDMLTGSAWYYNGGSDTSLNRLTFRDDAAVIENVYFDGNGKHSGGKKTCTYSYDDSAITVQPEDGGQLVIPYTFEGSALKLGTGDYFTLEEIDEGLQGFWKVRDKEDFNGLGISATFEYNIEIRSGMIYYESANTTIVDGYDFFYYGPYSGSYDLIFGGIKTDMQDGNNIFFNIIDGKPTLLYYTHVLSPNKTNRFPGPNGYRF